MDRKQAARNYCIFARRLSGCTFRSISRLACVSTEGVRQIVRTQQRMREWEVRWLDESPYGVIQSAIPDPLLRERHRDMYRAMVAGKSAAQVAREYGLCETSARALIHRQRREARER